MMIEWEIQNIFSEQHPVTLHVKQFHTHIDSHHQKQKQPAIPILKRLRSFANHGGPKIYLVLPEMIHRKLR